MDDNGYGRTSPHGRGNCCWGTAHENYHCGHFGWWTDPPVCSAAGGEYAGQASLPKLPAEIGVNVWLHQTYTLALARC